MGDVLASQGVSTEQNRRITEILAGERAKLLNFIRRRVPAEADAEDLLQDVFYEFVAAYRLMKPIEQAGAWLFRVARNRIIDRFRKARPVDMSQAFRDTDNDDARDWQDLLPSPEEGPDAAFARGVLIEELDAALDELPPEQREVFVAHELEGRSFKEMSRATGVSVNTLLSRKRYAVLQLRQRLQAIYNEFGLS